MHIDRIACRHISQWMTMTNYHFTGKETDGGGGDAVKELEPGFEPKPIVSCTLWP